MITTNNREQEFADAVKQALVAYLNERSVNAAEAKATSNMTAATAVVQAAYDKSPLKGGKRDFEAWQAAFNELKRWSKTIP